MTKLDMDNQQQLQPNPPAQNKLWPINWDRNKSLKILGIICFFSLIIVLIPLLYFTFIYDYYVGVESPGFDIFIAILFSSPILFVAMIHVIVSLLKFKNLDKSDKIFLLFTLLIVIIFLLIFFIGIPCIIEMLPTFDI
jgi:cytochrome c biogenesis factor